MTQDTNTSIPSELRQLAPGDLKILRKERYDGGGMSVKLKDFDPEDIALILRVYKAIKTVYDISLYAGMHRNESDYSLFADLLETLSSTEFTSLAQNIGTYTQSNGTASPQIDQVVHDVRGGCLMSLTGYAGLLQQDPTNAQFLKTAIALARDHAKMMRNAISDLDVPVRNADESIKIHSIDGFLDKLEGAVIKFAEKQVQVSVHNTFKGDISNRCLETSAIDRIIYNYLNNAARFTSDGHVNISVFQTNPHMIRWVIANKVSPDQTQWLEDKVGDLQQLFDIGTTRDSTGIGLHTCAEFIRESFGLPNAQTAVKQGYIGAKLIDNHFYAWFHWPIYYQKSEHEQRCDCRTE